MSLLDNSEFIKRIEKYDKIIDEENMKYKNYCHILKKILEHTPNTEMEKVMRNRTVRKSTVWDSSEMK